MSAIETCHNDLQLVFNEAKKYSAVRFDISEGYRTPERQMELYKQGRSYENGAWAIKEPGKVVTNIDGVTKKSKHGYQPSMAFDIFISGGRTYDQSHLSYVAGVIVATGDRLQAEGKIAHKVRWGGNWNGDGEIIFGQTLVDLPHFELSE